MSHRLSQINTLLQQEINNLLLTDVELLSNCLVTITRVETTKDLKLAKVWISTLPAKNTKKILEKLNKTAGYLQFRLYKKLFLKPLPKIQFFADLTEQKASEIERLLDKIKQDK